MTDREPHGRRVGIDMILRNSLAIALALGASLGAHRMPASADAHVDRIMFASNRGGTMDLYSMNDDGTDIRLVVGGPRDEMHPDISPDGTRIAFVRADDVARPLSEGGCCGPAVDLLTADIDGGTAATGTERTRRVIGSDECDASSVR